MAAGDAADSQSKASTQAMQTNGLLDITGATGRETAAALHADHEFQGRKDNAVGSDQKDNNGLHERFSMAKFPKKATRYRRNQFMNDQRHA
jgi:hypothetical protein